MKGGENLNDFGTAKLLPLSIGAILFSSIWLGWLSLVILVLCVATYVLVLKETNEHFRPDGTLRRRGNDRHRRR
jgi:hypothetical protein